MAETTESPLSLRERGRGVRAAGTGHRPNPYIQVALTYLRRPGPWWLAIVLAIALLSVLVSHDPRYDLLVLWVFVLFVWLPGAQHVKEQFADPRAHLVPNFRRVHSTVASAWAVVFAVLLPAALAWHAGYHSVAPVAVSLAVLGGLIWMALLESTRLIPAVFMFWLAFSLNRHEDHLVAFLSGQAEGWAILVLLAGAAATVLGATRCSPCARKHTPIAAGAGETGTRRNGRPTPASANGCRGG